VQKLAEVVESEIARRLAAALTPDSPNEITATEVQQWAVEYLASYDKELERFPEDAGEPHWNLWMMDARFEDALFVVLIFRREDVEFFCGTGDAFQIRSFAERTFPDDPNEVLPEMSRQFSIPQESLCIARKAAEEWLGRSW
jgi:hypothetical protein